MGAVRQHWGTSDAHGAVFFKYLEQDSVQQYVLITVDYQGLFKPSEQIRQEQD